ncbi:MAG: NTP transferase domain-containing protein [Fastidiosipilaceae bacterium]|nr:NTP transferase domain-containing protein [Clostridiaceae bacterium]
MTTNTDRIDSIDLRAVVLAAGKGTRLQSEKSDLPKVMRRAAGRPLLGWVLDKISFVDPSHTVIVVGYKAEAVQSEIGAAYQYALQEEQLGTGHAVQMAMPALANFEGPVLICYGDMPLISESTYRNLFSTHIREGNACTMLAYISDKDLGYGRIVRDDQGIFKAVVEDRDCTPEQKNITELNAGVYVFDAAWLREGLNLLQNNNAQGEYYLTDVPTWIQSQGGRIGIQGTTGEFEGIGVNTQEDLDLVNKLLA